MAIYVDSARRRGVVNGKTGRWSHLLADTTEELLAAAASLGVPQDISASGTASEYIPVDEAARSAALKAGATRLNIHGVTALIRRKTLDGTAPT